MVTMLVLVLMLVEDEGYACIHPSACLLACLPACTLAGGSGLLADWLAPSSSSLVHYSLTYLPH